MADIEEVQQQITDAIRAIVGKDYAVFVYIADEERETGICLNFSENAAVAAVTNIITQFNLNIVGILAALGHQIRVVSNIRVEMRTEEGPPPDPSKT